METYDVQIPSDITPEEEGVLSEFVAEQEGLDVHPNDEGDEGDE